MNINKSLEHFKWKFENSWKPTEKDVEAFNSIIAYKEMQESYNLQHNESLAKLWIHQMMLLARTKNYNGERCVQVIDEILNISVYDWCLMLKEEIPMMRFNSVGNFKYPLSHEDEFNMTKIQERNAKIIDEFEDELIAALKYEISEENIIKFVERNITRIINKYEK